MTEAAESDAAGPEIYQNWRAQILGSQAFGACEVPIYSDARVTGAVKDGLGPYSLTNGLPSDERDPAIVLTMYGHLDPNKRSPMEKTDTTNFTGAWRGDEMAVLAALAFGARFMAGSPTRTLINDGTGSRWIINGDRDRPNFFTRPQGRARVLPWVVQTAQVSGDLLATLPRLTPVAATALVRAARSYRDALWIAEAEPELSWLLLVSALEVAAVYHQIDQTSPLEILRSSKPALVASLERLGSHVVEEVAVALARELRATARFLDFMVRFMPGPPAKRPVECYRLDWTSRMLKILMKKVYELRSSALHEGIPFPPPMCRAPWRDETDGVYAEIIPGLAESTTGGVWSAEDTPLSLHSFEYIARGALTNWWKSLAGVTPLVVGVETTTVVQVEGS